MARAVRRAGGRWGAVGMEASAVQPLVIGCLGLTITLLGAFGGCTAGSLFLGGVGGDTGWPIVAGMLLGIALGLWAWTLL